MTSKMLNGLDGRKMSTSWGNIITIVDTPQDMYGKMMSMKDESIDEYFELATSLSKDEIEQIKKISSNPRDIKAVLAKEVVKIYHGEKKAEIAREEFNKIFRDKQLPSEIEIFKIPKGYPKKLYLVLDLLCDTKLTPSKNEAKRLVEAGAVRLKINGQESKISNWKEEIKIEDGMIFQVGPRRFIKIKIK